MIIFKIQILISITLMIFVIVVISTTTPSWLCVSIMIIGLSLMWYALGEISNSQREN